MRWLLGISAIWFAITLTIGVAGGLWLDANWRSTENKLLVREASLVAATCANANLGEPWESDPKWSQLESRWNLDIVPIYGETAAANTIQLVALDDTSSDGNDWTRLPTGKSRISRSIRLANIAGDHPQRTVIGVRVTRTTEPSENGQWWLLWFSTLLLGLGACGLSALKLRQLHKNRQISIKPWVNAARQFKNGYNAKLPEFVSDDDDTSVQLSILGEAVNRWLGELQGAVQRNELVLSNMQEGVLAVDHKSRVLLANAALGRMLDISLESYLYRSLVEVIRAPRVTAIINRVLASSTPQEDSFEQGSQKLSLRLLVHPVQLGNGRIGALMTLKDETILKQVESVRRDFVTNASHELKTPLAAIRGYAETLQMGALSDTEAAGTFIAGILAQADRINGLITGMLKLAQAQSGGATLKRVRFEVRNEIETCLDAAEVMAKSKSIELTKEILRDPLYMHGDPEGLRTIVSNLLSNAIRYTPSGGQVSLKLFAAGAGLSIRVQDTGIGIEKEDLARIFERFYRVELARSADTGGTGLGLSIVKHLLHSLGGSITVTSEPNRGSCFEVYLPIEPP